MLENPRIHLRRSKFWVVSHNAIEIGIRWLTLSFYEPSKFYLVLVIIIMIFKNAKSGLKMKVVKFLGIQPKLINLTYTSSILDGWEYAL